MLAGRSNNRQLDSDVRLVERVWTMIGMMFKSQ